MAEGLDFKAEEFMRMSVKERIALCHRLSARARQLAEMADPKFRESYSKIADEWLDLAAVMETASR